MNNESIGTRLKRAREEKKITLDQVYSKTKVHINVLQAVEEDRFQEYSPVYIKGFLRIYSQFLGLDTDSILKEYHQRYHPKSPEIFRAGFSRNKIKINWNLLKLNFKLIKKAIIALTVIIILIFFVSFLKNIKTRVNARARVKQPQGAPVVPVQEKKEAKFARLAVRARDNSWLKVKLDGKVVLDGVFKKNMSDSWQANEKIELSVANAGAIEVEINGQVLSPLGRKNQSIKNIIITKDGFSIGKSR